MSRPLTWIEGSEFPDGFPKVCAYCKRDLVPNPANPKRFVCPANDLMGCLA